MRLQAQAYWAHWQRSLTEASQLLQAEQSDVLAAAWPGQQQPEPQPAALTGGTLIQEMHASEPTASSPELPIAPLLLACSLHAAADSLPAPWSSPELAAEAIRLLDVLSGLQPPASKSQQSQRQQLLCAAFPQACEDFRAFLLCQPQSEAARLEPYTGELPTWSFVLMSATSRVRRFSHR